MTETDRSSGSEIFELKIQTRVDSGLCNYKNVEEGRDDGNPGK